MVESVFFKSIISLPKKILISAIILCVIANFVFGKIVLAKKIELTDKEVERIKTSLDLVKAFVNFTLNQDKLKDILNTIIHAGETSTDITYGLLILSALNEMDLIDLIVSQEYKRQARNYFNNVLDERLNLFNYYTGIGYDIPKAVFGSITGPFSALTLNTFSITSKAIEIYIAFENIKTVKLYDGLWFYFDLRKNHESHKSAWDDTKELLGWLKIRYPFNAQEIAEMYTQLESQFAILFEKWGPLTTSKGVNEEVKKQTKQELTDSFLFAMERYKLVEKETSPSFFAKVGGYFKGLLAKLKDAGSFIASTGTTSQETIKKWLKDVNDKINNLFNLVNNSNPEISKPVSKQEKPNKSIEKVPEAQREKTESQNKELKSGPSLKEIQDELDDISETIEIIAQEISKLKAEKGTNQGIEELEKETEKASERVEKIKKKVEEKEVEEQPLEESIESSEFVLCEKFPGYYPARNKIIINEVAWMGTVNSANDEWIELKNISNVEINLHNWQLLDKDKKIKIVFNNLSLKPNRFLLLERTNDDSVVQISADLIYTGALGNTNEILYLFDENCYLEDEVLANPNWIAGDNSTKRTMERKNKLEWQTSFDIGGTPKAENSKGYYEENLGGGGGNTTTPTSTSTPPSIPEPIPKILITEVQIKDASSSNHDFIELYNPSTNTANISRFQLKKKTSTGKEYSIMVFPKNTNILPNEYFLWVNSDYAHFIETKVDATTTQTLSTNNSIVLLDKEKNIVDALAWGTSTNPFVETTAFPKNPDEKQSLGRMWSSSTNSYIDTDNNLKDFQIQEPTPKAKNKQKEPEKENLSPVALFSYAPKVPTTEKTVLFNASSSTDPDGNINLFVWNFGDNNSTTTNLSTTTHAFASSGSYTISLIVIDNNGAESNPATTSITIIEKPIIKEKPSQVVVINEIAWMGTKANSFDEWIELYNTSSTVIDLNNWSLVFGHGTNTSSIIFTTSSAVTTTVPAKGFYLIERSDDNTINDIAADWFGSFGKGLNNNGEKIELRDQKGNLVDIVDCSDGWFAGKTSPDRISMEKINAFASGTDINNWADNNLFTRDGKDIQENNINGTPKNTNSVCISPTSISNLPFNEFEEITLAHYGSPYIIEKTLFVPKGKTLKINPGTILKFSRSSAIEIKGKLLAEGENEATRKIFFTSLKDDELGGDSNNDSTSTQPAPGDWLWLYFQNTSGSRLQNVVLKYGAGLAGNVSTPTFSRGTISVENGELTIKDSVFEKGLTVGVWLINSSSTIESTEFIDIKGAPPQRFEKTASILIEGGSPIVKDSIFQGNKKGIEITLNAEPEIKNNIFKNNEKPIYFNGSYPYFKGNIAEDNKYNGIFVGGSTLTTTTWDADLPYIIENTSIGAGATLIIKPGTIIKFDKGGLGVGGKILTQGNPNNPVVFTSLKDDEYGGDTNNDGNETQPRAGNWGNIRFSSSGTIFENTIIRYGGRKGSPWWINIGALTLGENIKIEIKNSLIEKNIYAISFPNTTSCETINATIEGFKAKNTVFKDNEYLTYPICK